MGWVTVDLLIGVTSGPSWERKVDGMDRETS